MALERCYLWSNPPQESEAPTGGPCVDCGGPAPVGRERCTRCCYVISADKALREAIREQMVRRYQYGWRKIATTPAQKHE